MLCLAMAQINKTNAPDFLLDPRSIGGRIVAARKQASLSQRDLAQQAAIRPSRLSKLERGVGIPKLEECLRLCQRLELDLNRLVLGRSAGPEDLPFPAVRRLAALGSEQEKAGLERLFALLLLGYQAEAHFRLEPGVAGR